MASQTAGTPTGTSSTTNFTVDSTAPVVTLDSPINGTVLDVDADLLRHLHHG